MYNSSVIFFYIAIFSTVLFVVKLILFSIFGGDTEIETDFNTEIETETSFDFFSIQSILAFLMGFSWMAMGCQNFNLRLRFIILIAVTFGLLMMYFSAWLMFCTRKLNQKTKKDYSKIVGLTGKAYTSFKPHSEGQIEITFNNQLSIEHAINDTDKEIKAFSEIKITKYENKTIYIE